MTVFIGKRGPLYLYAKEDLIEVTLGKRECMESECVLQISNSYLKDLIAALRLMEDTQ